MSPQGGPGDGFPDYCGLDVVLFVLCLSHPFCPDYPDPPQTVSLHKLRRLQGLIAENGGSFGGGRYRSNPGASVL